MAEQTGRYEISSVTFEDEDQLTIVYMQIPGDVRGQGALVATHTLCLRGAIWAQDIEGLRDHTHDLLIDALEDFAGSEPIDPADLDPEADPQEKGMGE